MVKLRQAVKGVDSPPAPPPAPSRPRHYRNATVYGLTTAAMHGMSTHVVTPPPSKRCFSCMYHDATDRCRQSSAHTKGRQNILGFVLLCLLPPFLNYALYHRLRTGHRGSTPSGDRPAPSCLKRPVSSNNIAVRVRTYHIIEYYIG